MKSLRQRVEEHLAKTGMGITTFSKSLGLAFGTVTNWCQAKNGISNDAYYILKKAGIEMHPDDKVKVARIETKELRPNIPTVRIKAKDTVCIEIDEKIVEINSLQGLTTGRRIKLRVPALELESALKKYSNRNPKIVK